MARPDTDQFEALCHEAEQTIRRIRRDGPTVLARGSRRLHDGYPENSMPGPGGKGGISRPVERTALAHGGPDPVRAAAIRMIVQLRTGLQALRHADGARAKALGQEERLAEVIPLRGERGKGACEGCGAEMDGTKDTKRLKDGLCPNHWMRWLRRGRPDRAEFIAGVQAELAAKAAS